MYLTPERIKTLGLGIDLDEYEVVDIQAAIARSVARIHTYCAVPTIPQRYDFRGGTVTGEEHTWPIDPMQRPRPLQIWPWHTPVRTVTACRLVWGVQSSQEYYLNVDPANILIADAGYLEISSLNLSQLVFGDAVMPYIGLHNPVSRTSYTYGYRFTAVDEYITTVDAKVYQAENQFWTDDAVTVKVNGVTKADPADYTLNRREGWVIFGSTLDPDAEVTVSYTYSLPTDVAQACGILVGQDLDKAELRRKGMGGLVSIRVKDIELRRAVAAKSTGSAGVAAADMPEDAAALLDGWVFRSAR